MADLQTKSFQRESTPIYNKTAVQHEYQEPDMTVGQSYKNEQVIWEAASGFTKEIAKIVGNIDKERQKGIADDIIDQIHTDNLTNTVLIDNELPKLESSELDATEMMQKFASEGIKTEGGTIKMDSLESYEGYEFLSQSEKNRIKKQYNQSEILTKQNVVQQISALSRDHTNRRLDRLGINTKNLILGKLIDGRNYKKKGELAPYLQEFTDTQGPGDGPEGMDMRQFWVGQILKGNTNVPGAPEGGSSIKDLGSPSGLKDDIKTEVDKALDLHTEKVVDALNNDHIKFTDVQDKINEVMEFTLLEMFLGEYSAFPEQAIKRANEGGYSYTRDFDIKGIPKSTIKYQLDPAKLKPYIDRHNREFKDKQDPIEYAKSYNSLKEQLQRGEKINPNTWAKKAQKNKNLTSASIGTLMRMISDSNMVTVNKAENDDKDLILKEIKQNLILRPESIFDFATEQKDGTFKIDMDAVSNIIEDHTATKTDFAYDNKGKSKKTKTVTVTKAKDRRGRHLITESIMQSFVLEHIDDTRKQMVSNYENVRVNQITTQLGRDNNYDEYALFENDKPTANVDRSRIKNRWDQDRYLKRIFPSFKAYENKVSEILRKTFAADEKDKKTIPRNAQLGTGANMTALRAALRGQAKEFAENVKAKAIKNKDYYNHNPVDELLQKIRDKNNDQSIEWSDHEPAQRLINSTKSSLNNLWQISTQHHGWKLNELRGEVISLSPAQNSGGHNNITWDYSQHVRGVLQDRAEMLSNKYDAAELIRREITGSRLWHQKLGVDPTYDPRDLEDKVCQYIGIQSTRNVVLLDTFRNMTSARKHNNANPDQKQVMAEAEALKKSVADSKIRMLLPNPSNLYPTTP